jgi:hypothetical protein
MNGNVVGTARHHGRRADSVAIPGGRQALAGDDYRETAAAAADAASSDARPMSQNA